MTIPPSSFAAFVPGTVSNPNATWVFAAQNGMPQYTVQWGITGDIPVPGDYNGNGRTDIAVYRPSTGWWYILPNTGPNYGTENIGPGEYEVQWGATGPSAIPVPGDYTGAGKTEVAVYDPNDLNWFIAPNAGPNQGLGNRGANYYNVPWGAAGDIPVPGDYAATGKTDLAVFDPSTANWSIAPNSGPGAVNNNVGLGTYVVQFGAGGAGWIPVPGVYDRAHGTEVAIFDPSTANWFVAPNAGPNQGRGNQGPNTYLVQWGVVGDIPVPGDYEATGNTAIAVYRPSAGLWLIQPHTGGGVDTVAFTGPNYVPLDQSPIALYKATKA